MVWRFERGTKTLLWTDGCHSTAFGSEIFETVRLSSSAKAEQCRLNRPVQIETEDT